MNILVIGKAKTGTTVVSKAIEHSLPDARYYLEPRDLRFAYSSSFSEGTNNVVKILFEPWANRPHLAAALVYNETPAKFDRIVAIVRDPRDQLISLIHFYIDTVVWKNGLDREKLDRWIGVLAEKERRPSALSMMDVINRFREIYDVDIFKIGLQTRRYLRFLINHRKRLYILKYEDFVSRKISGLEDYLGFKLSERRDVGGLDHTPRTLSFNNWKAYMLPSDIEPVRNAFSDYMSMFGYDDWELAPVERLDTATGSAYTRRTAERRMAIMEDKVQPRMDSPN